MEWYSQEFWKKKLPTKNTNPRKMILKKIMISFVCKTSKEEGIHHPWAAQQECLWESMLEAERPKTANYRTHQQSRYTRERKMKFDHTNNHQATTINKRGRKEQIICKTRQKKLTGVCSYLWAITLHINRLNKRFRWINWIKNKARWCCIQKKLTSPAKTSMDWKWRDGKNTYHKRKPKTSRSSYFYIR